jgi:exonuclease V gamma subunit
VWLFVLLLTCSADRFQSYNRCILKKTSKVVISIKDHLPKNICKGRRKHRTNESIICSSERQYYHRTNSHDLHQEIWPPLDVQLPDRSNTHNSIVESQIWNPCKSMYSTWLGLEHLTSTLIEAQDIFGISARGVGIEFAKYPDIKSA